MNWKDIEDLINDNRESFEENISEHHLSRFETRLQKKSVNRRRLLFGIAASIAILIVGSGFLLYFLVHTSKPIGPYPEFTAIMLEFNETESYYTTEVTDETNHLKQLQFPDPAQKDTVLHELSLMDQNYQQLKTELEKNPGDERIMHSIILHYQVKLDALNRIITSLSYCQTNAKNKGHEQNI